jgi:hypothetical protein
MRPCFRLGEHIRLDDFAATDVIQADEMVSYAPEH